MTRHILTTATLVAFLAAGQAPLPATTRRDPDPVAPSAPVAADPVHLVRVDDRLVATHVVPAPGRLAVALQLEPGHEPPGLELWLGRKNGWGAAIARAHPEPLLPGFHRALVAVPEEPAAGCRLWLAVARPDRRPGIVALGRLAADGGFVRPG